MNASTASSSAHVGGQREVDALEVVAQVDADDRRALGAEQRGRRRADPAGRAGDHADLAVEPASSARRLDQRRDLRRRRVGLRVPLHAERERAATGPRSPPAAHRPSPSPSPRIRPRSRPRPDGDATSWDAPARPPRGRRASRPPAARRGRRTRPGRARWSSWPSTSGRCSISVPPRARFISCIPRQTPSSGRSRSIAASAERDLERVAVRAPRRSRRRPPGSARRAARGTRPGRRPRRAGAGPRARPRAAPRSRTTRGSSTASSSHTLQRARSTAAHRPMTGPLH